MKNSVIFKLICVILALAMCLLTMAGCQKDTPDTPDPSSDVSDPASSDSSDSSDPSDPSDPDTSDPESSEPEPSEPDEPDVSGEDEDSKDESDNKGSKDSKDSKGDKSGKGDKKGGKTTTITEKVPYNAALNPLQRGINFSYLEFDNEVGYDSWMFQGKYYDALREKGFDHVRLPVDFFLYMGDGPDYKIDEEFLRKVDTIINTCLSANLKIVLDFHHFGELQRNCNANKQKYYKMWEQLAIHYQKYPSGLVFELLNEPGNAEAIAGGSDPFTPKKIMEIQEEAIKIIRKTNPTRLIVHATCWNDGAAQLMKTEPLLPDDKNLIMSVHSYEPMRFTHQGADWNNDGDFYPITDFTEDMKYEIELVFTMIKTYIDTYGRPVWIGEFGALNSKAPEGARAKYAACVMENMKRAGCGWCWWEFQSGFGLYSTSRDVWLDEALIDALMK